MKLNVIFAVLILSTSVLLGCQSSPDFDELRLEILEIHDEFIDAHLNKNADYIANTVTEDYMFISNGAIRKPTKEETKTQFTRYLNNTTFSEYRYLGEPVVGFSDDGSLAWSVAKLKVVAKQKMGDGTESAYESVYAWTTIFKRDGNGWLRLSETSTNK
jgi:hypothetical protein